MTLLCTLQHRLIVKAVCEVYIVGAVTKIYMCSGCTFNEGRNLKTHVPLSIDWHNLLKRHILKLPLGIRIVNFVNFESLIYMMLYNLLILNKI